MCLNQSGQSKDFKVKAQSQMKYRDCLSYEFKKTVPSSVRSNRSSISQISSCSYSNPYSEGHASSLRKAFSAFVAGRTQ